MSELNRWLLFWRRVGAEGKPEVVFEKLVALYAEQHRAYHTLAHITHCLDEFEEVRHLAEHPNEVEMALWFHDAIYDTESQDSEERSAQLALKTANEMGLPETFGNRVHALIVATKHSEPPTETDTKILIDIDLSILGRGEAEFDEYEANVRREYHWVPEEEFKSRRAAILRSFMERQTIYSTDFFRQKYEQRARRNLGTSLSKLE